jgi:hypothetical protein
VLVWRFAAIYFVICYVSIACWAYAGSFLRHYLNNPRGMRVFNRTMALLLERADQVGRRDVGRTADLFQFERARAVVADEFSRALEPAVRFAFLHRQSRRA